GDKNGGGAGRKHLDEMEDFKHFGRRSDETAESTFVTERASKGFILGASLKNLAEIPKDGAQPAEIDRLLNVILYPEPAGMEGGLGSFLRGNHHYRNGLGKVGKLFDKLHSVHTRHLYVGDNDGGRKGTDLFERLHAIGGRVSAVAPTGNQFRQSGAFIG